MSDSLATQYLAVAPHFTVHRESDETTLLFSETRNFRLRGRFYDHLLRLLDGTLTGEEIAARMEGEVMGVLEQLYSDGHVVAVKPGVAHTRQAFWSAAGLSPVAAEARMAAFRVAVVGLGRLPAASSDAVPAMLATLSGAGLGVAVLENADLTIVLVDDYLDRDFVAFAEHSVGRILPVKPAGRQALIGPVLGPEGGGCPICLTRRMAEHRPNDGLIRDPRTPVRPAKAWLSASLEFVRATTVFEVMRLAMGQNTDILGHVIRLTPEMGARELHKHWRFFDCPRSGRRGERAATAAQPIELTSGKIGATEGGWRSLAAEDALARLEPLVSNLTGIVSDIEPGPDNDDGLYTFNAVQANPVRLDHMQNRQAGQAGAAGGKGASPLQARVSCLAEAVERYSCGWAGTEPRRLARMAELSDAAVHPEALLGFSDRQYENREALNAATASLHHIPLRFQADAEIEWTPVWSMTHETTRWLPSRFCYYHYRADNVPGDHAFCLGDSNGCAAGATLLEAALQGLLELIERDAVAIWWYNKLKRPAIALDDLDGALIERQLHALAAKGRGMHLLDLTTDIGVPAVVAISTTVEAGGRPLMGFGAHLDPAIAAERAITELNQILLFDINPEANDAFGKELADWLDTATLESDRFLAPGPPRRVTEMVRLDADGIGGAMSVARDRLASLGLELLIHDYARIDMPLACAKVVVPGLRHFWARRGPGRLNEVPVKMGWRDRALREDELNPRNFVL